MLALSAQGLAAVRLAELGFRVFALRPNSKEPYKGSKHTRTATTDIATVKAIWTQRPEANIGVLTSGLVVLDADSLDAEQAMDELELPPGPMVRTRRGVHRYFRGPGRSGPTSIPGLEVKAGGGSYVVGAGSTVFGHTYEWDVAPWEAPLGSTPALVGRLQADAPKVTIPTEGPIPSGERNTALVSLAGRLLIAGLDAESIGRTLLDVNARRCDPPLPEREVRRIASSTKKWATPPWSTGQGRVAFCADPRLSSKARHVLRALLDHVDPKGIADPGPSIDTLAKATGSNRDTVSAALRELEGAGRLKLTRRSRKPTRYAVQPFAAVAARADAA